MSTASTTRPAAETDSRQSLAAVINIGPVHQPRAAHNAAPEHSAAANAAEPSDRQLAELRQGGAATGSSANGFAAGKDGLSPADAIVENQTRRFDDTELKIAAGHHFSAAEQQLGDDRPDPASAVGFASAQFASIAGFDGATLALEPPAIRGLMDGLVYTAVKRLLDVAISSVMLILLSPLLLLTALMVKLTDGGRVFYPHKRIGEGGSEFICYKFRSMVVNAEKLKANLAFFNSHDDHRTFKIPNDPRVTWIGRWMRRTSIDELPQLLNVLQGEMSIVGPRPPVVSEVEKYTWQDMQRLSVKPGLTCIWQVSGRSRLPFPEQLKMDLQYIEDRSLALDLKLILLTVPAVLSADGAY